MEAGQEVQSIELEEFSGQDTGGKSLFDRNIELIKNVKVNLMVSLGECELTVDELFSLKQGSTVKLDKEADMPVDILLEGKTIACGKLVAVGDNFGVSITEIKHY